MRRLTVYKANGEITESMFSKAPKLEVLQKAVGGYIETVPATFYATLDWFNAQHPDKVEVWCDEDAQLKPDQEINEHFPLLLGDVAVVDTVKA